MMNKVAEALATIPRDRDALNAIDDKIAQAIRRIETLLSDLRVGVSAETDYETPDGRFVLSYARSNATWHIMWGSEAEDDDTKDVPLLSAPRHARGEACTPCGDTGLTPIENLVIALARQLTVIAQERHPLIAVADRIVSVLEGAAVGRPTKP